MINLLVLFWIIFLVFVLCFLPGYLVVSFFLRDKKLAALEVLSLSFGISNFLYFIFIFIFYLLNLNFYFPTIFLIVNLIVIFLYFFKIKLIDFKINPFTAKEIYIFYIFFIFIFSLQAIIPVYAGGGWYGDWWEHYFRAQFFLQKMDLNIKIFNLYTIFARTPLFNLVQAFFLTLLGDNFVVYQIVSTFLSTIFVLPVILILKNIFQIKNLKLLLVLLIFNSYLVQMSTYTFTKSLTAFYVLLAIYFYLKFKQEYLTKVKTNNLNFFLYVFLISCGYLTHQSALFYFFALTLDLILLRKKNLIIISFVIFFIVTSFWHFWALKNAGLKGVLLAIPTFSYEQKFNFLYWVKQRVYNIYGAFLPSLFFYQYKNYSYLPFRKIALYDCWQNYLFGSLTAVFNLAGFIFLIKTILQKIKINFKNYFSGENFYFLPLMFLVIFGFIFDVLSANNSGISLGVAQNGMLPLVLILFMIFYGQFIKSSIKLQIIIGIFFIIDFIVAHWIFYYILLSSQYKSTTLLYYSSNYALKLNNNITFIKDFLADYFILFIVVALILQLSALYYAFIKK